MIKPFDTARTYHTTSDNQVGHLEWQSCFILWLKYFVTLVGYMKLLKLTEIVSFHLNNNKKFLFRVSKISNFISNNLTVITLVNNEISEINI